VVCGEVKSVDTTDGLRATFANGEIVHLRPSGNAPELRCYNEAHSRERVGEINQACMRILSDWR
jgi:phosphomannomutase